MRKSREGGFAGWEVIAIAAVLAIGMSGFMIFTSWMSSVKEERRRNSPILNKHLLNKGKDKKPVFTGEEFGSYVITYDL